MVESLPKLAEILATTPLANQQLAEVEILDTGENAFVVEVSIVFSKCTNPLSVLVYQSSASLPISLSIWIQPSSKLKRTPILFPSSAIAQQKISHASHCFRE